MPHPTPAAPLKYLFPGWYAIVMGLCGLSLAFHQAVPSMGAAAGAAALALAALAALVFAILAAATALRALRHPDAWAEDRQHPVRHTFVATLPIALILLATAAVAAGLHAGTARPAVVALWWAGSLSQLFVTAWVLSRWWRGNGAGGLQWASLTPALFIPVVGNVLAPLAGVTLGFAPWAAAQFGVGLLFWPVVAVLLMVRVATQGMWPERLLPATFIFIAPPAVVGLSTLQLGGPLMLGWVLWGMALFTTLWVGALARRIAALPFGLPHWGMSFPLAAMAAFTLRLAEPGTPMVFLGMALLALASIVILGLLMSTIRGLRDGSLLAPEPVAAIQPAA
jgi:tellurite resistance protein